MTPEQLAAIKARADAAEYSPNASVRVKARHALVEDIPALVAEVERLRAALEAAKRYDHVSTDMGWECPALRDPPRGCQCWVADHNAAIDRALRGEEKL